MRNAFASWNTVVVAVIAPLLGPAAWAQGVLTLTPLNPVVLFADPNYKVDVSTLGSVTITDAADPNSKDTISIAFPPSITTTGVLPNGDYTVSPAAQFIVNQTIKQPQVGGFYNNNLTVFYDAADAAANILGCHQAWDDPAVNFFCYGVVEVFGGSNYVGINVRFAAIIPPNSYYDEGVSVQFRWSFTSLPSADLAITAIEPVQVVHNWPPVAYGGPNGSEYKAFDLPLIANKRTVVRVFIKSLGANAQAIDGVTAVLHGYFSSASTPGAPDPLQPFTAPITVLPYNGPIPLTSPPDFNEKTVDFELPIAWLQNTGGFSLDAEIVLPPGFTDSDTSNNKMDRVVALQGQPANPDHQKQTGGDSTLRVGYMGVCNPLPGIASCICPAPAGVMNGSCPSTLLPAYGYRIRDWYPVARNGLQFFQAADIPRHFTTTANGNNLSGYITAFRGLYHRLVQSPRNYFDFLIVYLTDTSPTSNLAGLPGGSADGIQFGGEGRVAFVVDYAPPVGPAVSSPTGATFSAYNTAHELGHLMGLEHALGLATGCPLNRASVDCTNWPYYPDPNLPRTPPSANPLSVDANGNPTAPEPNYAAGFNPSIQFPGYDVANHRVRHAAQASPFPDALQPADMNFDLMSYCVHQNPGPSNEADIWVSPFTYQWLYSSLLYPHDRTIMPWAWGPGCLNNPTVPAPNLRTNPAATGPRARPNDLSSSQDLVMIGGTVSADGSTGSLDPVFHLTTWEQDSNNNPNGNYCLQFSDASANVLGSPCFAVSFQDPETLQPISTASFFQMAALPPGTATIALLASGVSLASVTGGAQPPTVTFNSPHTGDTWQGGVQNLSWSGSASGSNPLSYITDYSNDGGVTWLPLSESGLDTQSTLDASRIDGGPNVFFRVQASDGVNTAIAAVGPVNVIQAPLASPAPAAVDFRNSLLRQPVIRQVVLNNSGSGPLHVTASQTSDPAFELVTPGVPFTVPANGSVNLELSFSPPGTGPLSGSLTLTSDATDNPSLVIPLQGNGIASTTSDAAVTPASVDFGSTTAGNPVSQTVNLQSYGPAPLQVSAVTITGAGFSLPSPPGGFTLGMNGSQGIALQFSPVTAGVSKGALTVSSDDPVHGTILVPLSGTGTGSGFPPLIVLSATSLAFGNVSVGQPATMSFTVSNTGGADLTVSSVATDNPKFTPSPNSSTVHPGASQTVSVQFTPVDTTAQSGTLTVMSNAANVTVALSGTGTAPQISAPPTVDFGDVQLNSSPPDMKVTIANKGAGPLSVSSLGSPAAPFSLVSPPALPVDVPAAGLTLTVHLSPTTTGAQSGSLVINSNDPDTPALPVALKANVAGPVTGGGTATGNLILNGDAETAPSGTVDCTSPVVPNWTATQGSASICPYLNSTINAPPNSGKYYFKGHGGNASSTAAMTQSAVLPLAAAAIDGGLTGFALTGYLGGYGLRSSSPQVTITFLDASSKALGQPAKIGPVLATERTKDKVSDGMELRSAAGAVPSGARTVKVDVLFADTGEMSGGNGSDDAIGDNFSLILAPPPGFGPTGLTVSPASLNFGSVSTGASKDMPLTLTNNRTATVTVSKITSSNPSYTVLPPSGSSFPLAVVPGTPKIVTVHFAPTAVGSGDGALTIFSDDPPNPTLTVTLTGTITAPVLDASPSTLSFGNVNGGESSDMFVKVSNNGQNSVSFISITSTNSRFYSTLGTPFGVGGGSYQFVGIRFAPELPGPQSGVITFKTSDPALPSVTVNVSGTGVGSFFSPSTLDFGTVKAGQTKDLAIQIKNNTNAIVTVNATTSSNARFTLLKQTPLPIGPGSFEYVTMRFSPTATGAQSGTLTIVMSDPVLGTVMVPLSGTGN